MTNNAYIFFGKSGSGKGTQAQLLIETLKSKNRPVLYIETGMHLREFMESGSYVAGLTKQALGEGRLLPEFLPITVWGQVLNQNYTGAEDLVLDGLARRFNEAEVLENALKYLNVGQIYVIFIQVSNTWSTERLLGRGRADDDTNEIQKRLEWFDQNTMPSVEYFKHKTDFKFIEINGEQSIEQVHTDILKAIN